VSESPQGASATPAAQSTIGDFVGLTKPRLTSLVIATAAVGFFVGSPEDANLLAGALMVAGMICVVGGGNALNQFWERDVDSRMNRTRKRPLPDERLSPKTAVVFGAGVSLIGLSTLFFLVNPVAAATSFTAWAIYVFVYTPLKQKTSVCTLIGAIPGAIPPLVGWAAARGRLDPEALSLFAIIFVWQIPHFFAISRHYREDYARGGFPMLGVLDPDGAATGRLSFAYAALLVPVAALPTVLGLAGVVYLWGSLALGIGFFGTALWSLRNLEAGHERWLFLSSLIYLTVLMALLLIDRIPQV